MQQIAVRAVKLDGVEAEPRRSLGRGDERIANPREAFAVERQRRVVLRSKRHGGGRDGLPAAILIGTDLPAARPWHMGRGFSSRMGELDGDRHVGMPAHGFENPRERRLVLVGPETEVVRADATLRDDGGRFDDEETGSREREVAQMNRVPIRRAAVFGRVLAHGRDDDAVSHFERTDAIGGEQRAHGVILMPDLSRPVRARARC